jgi:hypothetical protein
MEPSAGGVQIRGEVLGRRRPDRGAVNGFALANRFTLAFGAVLMLETARTRRDAGSL